MTAQLLDRWVRAHPEGGRTQYRKGPWTIVKEHYADGPSLFVWVLYRDNVGGSGTRRVDEFGRLRDAKAHAGELDAEPAGPT